MGTGSGQDPGGGTHYRDSKTFLMAGTLHWKDIVTFFQGLIAIIIFGGLKKERDIWVKLQTIQQGHIKNIH